MAKITDEFKEFISRGNMMDMAVGIIIGGAFTAIVNSLVSDLIQPLIEFITGGGTEISGLVVPGTHIDFGAFISACINFLIIAIVVFSLIKSMNKLREATDKARGIKKEEEAEPRKCPFCCEVIADEATRCPHCTAELQ
jgi:large conductance mechanosensitive channel